MGKIAVTGCTLKLSDVTYGGVISITSSPSTNITVGNKGVYCGSIKGTISGCIDAKTQAVQTAPANFEINGTGTNGEEVSGVLKKFVLQGDQSGTVSITLTNSSSGAQITIVLTVSVSNAGQAEVDSN